MAKTSTPDRKAGQTVDIYQMVTDRIITALQAGTVPWKKTWQGLGFARNYVTKRQYSGINALLTNLSPHPVPYFLTMRQILELGGHLIKGAKSIPIVYWQAKYKDSNGTYYTEAEAEGMEFEGLTKYHFIRYYQVYSISEVEGISFSLPFMDYSFDPIPSCEQLIDFMPNPPEIYIGANNPCYRPPLDLVQMPNQGQFESIEEYYQTFYHELMHSTGHAKRLARPAVVDATVFGSLAYSKEELTAEIGASFLGAVAGIDLAPVVDNSTAYINGWLKLMKGDKRVIFEAAKEARQGANFIIEK